MADIKQMENETIQKEIADKGEALRKFRFGEAGSRSRNVREGRNLRKEIARLKTEQTARRLALSQKTA